MCNANVLNVIVDEISNRVNGNEMFTHYDITLAVRNQFSNDKIYHKDIKHDIQIECERFLGFGAYDRVLRDMGNGQKAFVYYPQGSDPSGYVPNHQPVSAASSSSSVTVVSPPQQQTQTSTQIMIKVATGRVPDARGSITVPSKLLEAAGFGVGDIVLISYTRTPVQEILVAKDVPNGYNRLTTYKVDKNNNVRITKYQLLAAGMGSGSYEFERNGNEIVVRPH